MLLKKHGLDVQIPDDQVVSLVMRELLKEEQPKSIISPFSGLTLPAYGEYWTDQGGEFAGIVPGKDGVKYCALVSGPLLDGTGRWEAMRDKAAAVEVDGHKDFRLPTKLELSLLKATMENKFRTDDWYWSIERHPADEDYAFAQDFEYGGQYDFYVDDGCLACAVRIVPIQ